MRQIDRPRPLPCGLVVKNGSSTRGRFSAGIPHPVSAMAISTSRSAEPTVTVIRPPCGVASRALVSRLRNTCSRSLWLQATAGISSGTSTCSSMALRLMPYLQDGRSRFDRAPHVSIAAPPRRVARERQHPAEDPPADLERLLDVLEVLRKHGWRKRSAAKVRLHLLDQRQHRPERVVHVV